MQKRAAKSAGSVEVEQNAGSEKNVRLKSAATIEVEKILRPEPLPHVYVNESELDIEPDDIMTGELIFKPRAKKSAKNPAARAASIPAIRSAEEIMNSLGSEIESIEGFQKPVSVRRKVVNRRVEKLPDGVEPPKPKRPGRPRKVILKHQVPRQGIIHEPSNAKEANGTNEIFIFEVVYENPLMFKKIFSACKSIDADSVRLRFGAGEMNIYARNEKNTQVFARVLGDRINSYYSGSPGIEIGLKLDAVIGVLGTINIENSKIQINTRQRLQNEKVRIIGNNDQDKQRTTYEIAVQSLPKYDWKIEEELAHERDYAITFEISFKSFKKLVSDAKICGAEVVHLEKEAEGNLRFSYALADNGGRGDIDLYDNTHIKLRSNMTADIFSSSVYLEHIKGLSASLISDSIEISADPDRNMIMTSYLDYDITDDKKIIPDTEKAIVKFVVDIVRA